MADSSLATRSRRKEPRPPEQQLPARSRMARSHSPLQMPRSGGRITRSQSGETADDVGLRNRSTGREIRQASAESAGGGQGSDITARRRRGKERTVRAGAGVGDLSTVAEDPPVEHPNLEQDTPRGDDRQDAEEAIVNAQGDVAVTETDEDDPRDAPESPTGISTISGTTARTSHSVQELADLDGDLILEVLPTLSDTSSKLLGILVPAGATKEEITNITKGLLLPGSKVSRRVKFQESSFQSAREEFGSDHYIDLSIIGRALLGVKLTRDIGTGPWSPDPLLQKANLAIFATRMLIYQRGSQDLWAAVALLDSKFPAPFLSTLEPSSGSVIGSSQLLRQTFDLALNLRTQLMLIILSQHMERPTCNPGDILQYVFYEGEENNIKGWTVPSLGGGGSPLPAEFEKLVRERTQHIRQSFTEPAEMPAELKRLEETFQWLDFLSEVVSWTNLRLEEIERHVNGQGGTDAIVLALRKEIDRRQSERNLKVGNEAGEEEEEEEEADGEGEGEERLIDLTFEPPAWKAQKSSDQEGVAGRVPPAIEMIRRVPGIRLDLDRHSSYWLGFVSVSIVIWKSPADEPQTSFNSAAGVAYLKKREATRRSIQEQELPALHRSPSQTADNQTASIASPSQQNQALNRAHAITGGRDEDDWRPQYDDDGEDDGNVPATVRSSTPPPSSATAVLNRYKRHQREKNKENVTLRDEAPRPKKSFIDPQVGAKRVDFSEDLEDSQPTSFQKPKTVDKGKKRSRDTEEQTEEENEADGFEIDDRPVKVTRRKRLRAEPQPEPSASLIPASPSPERSRPSQPNDSQQRSVRGGISKLSQQHHATQEASSSQYRRPRAIADMSSLDSEDSGYVDIDPKPKVKFSSVTTLAKRYVVKTRGQKPQVRRAWTDREVNQFIKLVEEHGPSWARIEKVEDPLLAGRSQVNLKDKARNIKFDFLKAQIDIPVGFKTVRLNRYQINTLGELGISYEQ